VLFLLRLVARLPLPLLHGAGVTLGWIVYMLSPRYRKYLKLNLDTAGLRGFRLRCAAITESGKGAMELPAVWLRPHERVVKLVVGATGWERVEAAAKLGKGVIMVAPHLGSWEMTGQYIAGRIPVTVMYSPPKMKLLEPFMQAGRNRGTAMKSVPADLGGVRALLRVLRHGGAIGVLPDQVPGVGDGEWVEFFGRPAYTMTLISRLVEQTGATALICYSERLPWGRGYRFVVEPMLAPRPPESHVRALNRSVEQAIRRRPEQYLWGYNRYKVPAGVQPPGEI
jgi:KDO2-lipid IV(A) lauroyltransferase